MRGRQVVGPVDPFVEINVIVDGAFHAEFEVDALSLAGRCPDALAKAPLSDEAEGADEELIANEGC